jgi:hypothetical protein
MHTSCKIKTEQSELVRVPEHEGIAGNETDYLAKTGPEHTFTGPEPACDISFEVAKRAVRNWMNKNHIKPWESLTGLKQAKELIVGPSAKRSKDLLKLNRVELRWIVGVLTGHCHLKGHLFKLRLTVDSIREICLEQDESATHVLYDCEAIAHLWFHHLDQFFMEPGDYFDATISKVLHFSRSMGLVKHKRSPMVAVQGPRGPPPSIYIYIHILRRIILGNSLPYVKMISRVHRV